MISRSLRIAMLAGNPAFGGILRRTLELEGGHAVASFAGIEMLTAHLRSAPVDVVILDTDVPGAPTIDIARGLRQHLKAATPDFRIVALTRTPAPFHTPLLSAGIDRVLTKPVAPNALLAAVEALFVSEGTIAVSVRALEGVASMPAWQGNVVSLFGERQERC